MEAGWGPGTDRVGHLGVGTARQLVLKVIELVAGDERAGRQPDVGAVTPVGAKHKAASADLDPERAQREAARVDRLLTVTDQGEGRSVPTTRQRHQQADAGLRQVLGLVSDHRRVSTAYLALRRIPARPQPSAARSISSS
jgi:hypothetical protein